MGRGFNDLTLMMGKTAVPSSSQESKDSLPSYWESAVDALAATMKARQEAAGYRAFQFIWFSDLHGINDQKTNDTITSRVTHIGSIAQYAAEKYDIPFVAIAGDIMSQTSHGSVSSVYTEYEQVRELLAPIDRDKLLMIKGNHDGAWGGPVNINGVSAYYLYNIGQKAIFNELFRTQTLNHERVFGGNGTYFYVDSPQKVRFIMLNSFTDGDSSVDENGYAVYNPMKVACAYGTEQLAWLADVALDVPDGWSVVVMGHSPIYGVVRDSVLLAGILNAYNNRKTYSGTADLSHASWGYGITDKTYITVTANADFTNAKGEVVGYFFGHKHIDMLQDMTATGYTFPCIGITTAGADVRDVNLNYPRVVDTTTETALDIVTVDMLNKVIYCDRLGAGEAVRLVGYGINSEPIAKHTVTNNLTNCTNSNSASTVTEGASYSATITAKSGYVLDSVTCTMGGSAVTVSGGVISIASVTGDIIITATAVEETGGDEPGGDDGEINILTTPFVLNGTSYAAIGYENDVRLSTSAGTTKADTTVPDVVTFGYIPVYQNQVIHVKGAGSLPSASANGTSVCLYSSSKAFTSGTGMTNGQSWNALSFANTDEGFDITCGSSAGNGIFIRICVATAVDGANCSIVIEGATR